MTLYEIGRFTSARVAATLVFNFIQCRRNTWSERDARMWQTVFPQMANWLPDDEADQLRFDFIQEIERLKAAA